MQGTTVRATIRLASRLYAMVRAMSVSSSRVRPLVNTMGRNTQMVVMVEAVTALVTCFAPCTAARAAGTPRPRRR